MAKKRNPKQNDPVLDAEPKPGLFAWLRGRFFAGIVIAAPIGITVWLVYSFVTFVDGRMKPLLRTAIPERLKGTSTGDVIDAVISVTPGLGVLFSIIVLTLLGAIAANLLGQSLIHLGERVVNRVPLVRNIYSALKQIFETLAADRQTSFKEVVMVEYPKTGTWAVGFITSQAKAEVAEKLGERKHTAVFVPTTPNPTSGFLIFVPTDEIIHLDMSVEDGAKLIISAGIVMPDENTPAEPEPTQTA